MSTSPRALELAVILAGGRSRRMGQLKASIRLGRRTLIERLAAGLAGMFRRVAVSLPADESRAGEIRSLLEVDGPAGRALEFFTDGAPDLGPLEGIRSSLAAMAAPRAFFIAADMPIIWEPLVRRLDAEAGRDASRRAAVPVWKGRPEPLYAVYGRGLLAEIEQALARGEGGAHALARWPGVATIDIDDPRVAADLSPHGPFRPGEIFSSINTPADRESLSEKYRLGLVLDDPVMGL